MIPFERSFASHQKSEFWSNKNTIKPEELYKGKQLLLICYTLLHKFKIH